jgi:exodeoxyribonuclease VII small subunit
MSEMPAPDIASLTFETALAELESIVQRLERGQLDLEASIAAYERGTALRRHCATKLEEARLRVEKITFDKSGDKNGKPRLEPADDQ